MLLDVGKDLLLGIGECDAVGDLVDQARDGVHVHDERVHRRERRVIWLDDEANALIDLGEVGLGDNAGNLDNLIGRHAQAGHLAIDPDESVVCRHGVSLLEEPAHQVRLRDDAEQAASLINDGHGLDGVLGHERSSLGWVIAGQDLEVREFPDDVTDCPALKVLGCRWNLGENITVADDSQ